jgi:hypothetical protein
MREKFEDYHWHDAELLSIGIDRSNPGYCDQIILLIRWLNGKRSEIVFNDCYALLAKLNFGIIARETIRDAEYRSASEEINEIRRLWNIKGAKLDDIGQYEIETNSTNSRITIISRGCYENELDK